MLSVQYNKANTCFSDHSYEASGEMECINSLPALSVSFSFRFTGSIELGCNSCVATFGGNHLQSEHDLRKYQAIKLSNGMTVLLVSDTQAPKSLAALALPVGSLEDPDNQLGLAHYLEHMVLMGSKHFPEPGSFPNS